MKTQEIQQIGEQIEGAKQALMHFAVRQHQEERYGPEQEYTAQSLKAGIAAILTDVSGLVKAHNKFVQLSTYSERRTINSKLEEMIGALTNSNYSDAANHLDVLKPILRGYRSRSSSETQDVLEERVNRLNSKCSMLEENIDTTEKIKERAEKAKENLQSSEKKLESLDETLAELQTQSGQVENLQSQSQQHYQSIEEALTSAKSHKEIIESFVQQIETRQQQLEHQQAMTKRYEEKLELYEGERKEKLDEAETLINRARNALGYRTAEGISAAFSERYLEERARGKISLWWLVGASLFVATSIGLGIWLVLGNQSVGIGAVLSRITIISVALSGAWFCAARYVKHRNTLEDYGYKAVLSKSIVAFLDQLTGEEREHYLKAVLLEIHKDPLRRSHEVDAGLGHWLLNKVTGKKKRGAQEEETD